TNSKNRLSDRFSNFDAIFHSASPAILGRLRIVICPSWASSNIRDEPPFGEPAAATQQQESKSTRITNLGLVQLLRQVLVKSHHLLETALFAFGCILATEEPAFLV